MITLLGPAATRKWWEAVKRGDVGVLERQVSLVHDKHARSLLAQNYSHYGSSTINDNFPSSLTLQQAVSNLINMQQPWEKVLKDEDPYLDEFDGGSSALILACGFGHTSIVSFLLSLGCVDLALTDANGMHALHHACVQGNADIVKILLAANPDLEIKTNDGDTGKHILKKYKSIQAHLDIRNFQSLKLTQIKHLNCKELQSCSY